LKNKVSRSKQEIKSIIGTKSIVQKAFEMVGNVSFMFEYKIYVNFM